MKFHSEVECEHCSRICASVLQVHIVLAKTILYLLHRTGSRQVAILVVWYETTVAEDDAI